MWTRAVIPKYINSPPAPILLCIELLLREELSLGREESQTAYK